MKRLFTYFLLMLGSINLFSQDFNIGNQRNLSTCSIYFYDAGGTAGFAGYDYQISTIKAESNACIGVTFESFDLGFGAELKIYKGTDPSTGILLGSYSGTNKPPVFSAGELTFEYFPPLFNIGNIPGWKAYLRCRNCDGNPMRPTDPASDCIGAIPLCSNNTVIVSTAQYINTGVVNDDHGSCFSGTGSGGSVWYSFSPQTNGNLDFSIAPSGSTDYDYVLYDMTNGCASLSEMSCNFSGTYGTTGITTNSSNYQSSYSGCSGSSYYSAPASCGTWNQAVSVNTTHTYALMVNFYGGSNDGFILHFQNDAGTVSITDNTPPTFANVTQPGCNGSLIHVTSSENINCTTLQAADFSIPGYTFSITNSGCVNGMTNTFDLNVSPPLPAGSYTLHGQTCNDMCGNALNDDFTFTIAIPTLTVTITGADFCSGSTTTLTANPSGSSSYSYLWDHSGGTGQTFTVSAGGTYCVTVTDGCAISATSCKVVNIIPTPVINTSLVCNGSNATLSVTGCTGTIQWQEWGTVPSSTPITNSAECTACGGSPVTLFGIYLSCSIGGSCPTTIPGWVNTGATTSSITVSPPYASQYQAICTSGGGCSAQSVVLVTCAPPLSVSVNSATICAGNCTNITATPTGGTGSYTYIWNPGTVSGAGPSSVCPNSTTTYYVTVTDGSGNTASASGVVTVNTPLQVNAGNDISICSGINTTLTATNGTSFVWSNGLGNPQIVSPASTTTYSVTGTDANGCTSLDQVVVTVNSSPTISISPNAPSFCLGSSVQLTASGATSYSWSPATGLTATNIANPTANPTVTTTYTVTGSYTSGCLATASVVVTISSNLTVSIAPNTPAICQNASVSLTASGGTSYFWSPGTGLSATNVATVTASPTVTTNYSVTASDLNGCSGVGNVAVTVNNLPTADAGNPQTVCAGTSVILNATGGSGFIWTNGVSQGISFIPVSNQTYYVTVTDINGCTATDSVSVFVNPLPLANAGIDASICSPGSTTLSASGGSTYQWLPIAGLNNPNISNPAANPSSTTNYIVTVTDANNCSNTDDVTITVLGSLVANAGPDISLCLNDSAQLNASGGNNYSWSPLLGLSSAIVSNPYVKPLVTTTYTVSVSDLNGCTGIDNVVVTINNLPNADAGNPQTICAGTSIVFNATGGTSYNWNYGIIQGIAFVPSATQVYNVTVTDNNNCNATDSLSIIVYPLPFADAGIDVEICYNTSTSLNASGGINFQWIPSAGLSAANVFNPIASPASSTTYTLIVADNKGCTDIDSVVVTVNPLPIADAGTPQSICEGDSAILNATGGITYIWGSGVLQGVAFYPVATANYLVTVTDIKGCNQTDIVSITITPLPIANAGPSQTICPGTSANLTATGGSSYVWSTNETTPTILVSPVLSTTYSVSVTQNGCSSNDTVVVNLFAPTPAPLVSSPTVCEGSAIPDLLATATGAVSWYSDAALMNFLDTGNTYTTDITNSGTYFFYATQTLNGCPSSSSVALLTINPLPNVTFSGLAAEYCINEPIVNLTGSPAGGTFSGSGIVASTFNPALAGVGGPYSIVYSATNAFGCSDTSSHFTVVNNIPSLNFIGLALNYCEQASPVLLSGNPAGGTFGGIGVTGNTFDPSVPGLGMHTLNYTYTDANGCINSIVKNVTITPIPTVVLAPFDSVCANSTPIILTGGTPIGGTYGGSGVSNGNFDPASGAGQHDIVYTFNSDGCTGADTATLIVNPLPVVTLSPLPNVCFYVPSFILTQGSPSGGSYSGDGVITGQFSPDSAGVGNHIITYTYTDSLGCTTSNQQNITVTVYPIPTSSFTLDDVVCLGATDTIRYTGSASQDATFQWDFGLDATSDSISPNEYVVIWSSEGVKNVSLIVHENGCSSQITIDTVTVVDVKGFLVTKTNLLCNGDSSGSALVSANGGTFPLSFLWSNGQNIASASNLAANNTYSVTITDINLCSDTIQVSLTEPLPLLVSLVGTDIKCFGDNDGRAYSSIFGGTSPYSYLWNTAPIQTADSAYGLFADIQYLLIVTDTNRCIDTATIILNQPPMLKLKANNDTIICPGSPVNLIAFATGGTPNFLYFWDNNLGPGTSHLVMPVSNTTYSVSVIDAMNCSAGPESVVVNIYPPLSANFIPAGPISICKNDSVLLNVNVSGSNASSYNFVWNNGLNNTIPPVSISPPSTTTYFITVSDPCSLPVTDSIEIIVYQLPTPSFITDYKEGCKPLTINFADSSTHSILHWLWKFGDNTTSSIQNPSHTYLNSGFYDVALVVEDSKGCKNNVTIQNYINVYPAPIAEYIYAPVGGTILESVTSFYDQSNGANHWLWYFGDTLGLKADTSNLQNPRHEFKTPRIYTVCLKTTNEYGCVDTACQKIIIKPDYTFYIPNAFTPKNKDGINDVFGPNGIGFDLINFEMQIYDRWGELIYVTKDINKPWNGCVSGSNTIAPVGVYVYTIFGTVKAGEDFKLVGSVTLIK